MQQNFLTDVSQYQVRTASSIYKSDNCYNQLYQVCVQASLPYYEELRVFVINEYWVCWQANSDDESSDESKEHENRIRLTNLKMVLPRETGLPEKLMVPNFTESYEVDGTVLGLNTFENSKKQRISKTVTINRSEVFNHENEVVFANYKYFTMPDQKGEP